MMLQHNAFLMNGDVQAETYHRELKKQYVHHHLMRYIVIQHKLKKVIFEKPSYSEGFEAI